MVDSVMRRKCLSEAMPEMSSAGPKVAAELIASRAQVETWRRTT